MMMASNAREIKTCELMEMFYYLLFIIYYLLCDLFNIDDSIVV